MAFANPEYGLYICDTMNDVADIPVGDENASAKMGNLAFVIDNDGNGCAVLCLNSVGEWKKV